ncbi:MAG: hypothetical protein WA960_20680 [Tunicatimonas sp.]
MNQFRVLLELNFLIRSIYELQVKLQQDEYTKEDLETIIMDVLFSGCRTLHIYREDAGPIYRPDETPYLQTLAMSVCHTYDVICERLHEKGGAEASLTGRAELLEVVLSEEVDKLSDTVVSIYSRM